MLYNIRFLCPVSSVSFIFIYLIFILFLVQVLIIHPHNYVKLKRYGAKHGLENTKKKDKSNGARIINSIIMGAVNIVSFACRLVDKRRSDDDDYFKDEMSSFYAFATFNMQHIYAFRFSLLIKVFC